MKFEPCPEVERTFGPLLPEDCLLSCRDTVPGVQRQLACPRIDGATSGFASGSTTRKGLGSQLEPAGLQPVRAVVLASVAVHLPEGFAELARKQAAGLLRQQQHAGAAAPSVTAAPMPDSRSLSLADLRRRLALRVSVHNGRRFFGPPVLCPAASLEPLEGRRGGCRACSLAGTCLQGLQTEGVGGGTPTTGMTPCACAAAGQHVLAMGRDAPVAWLPADAEHMVLVVELLLLGGNHDSAAEPGGGGGSERVLAWGAAAPFSRSAGGEAALAQALHRVRRFGGCRRG